MNKDVVQGTHWDGCERVHIGCAVAALDRERTAREAAERAYGMQASDRLDLQRELTDTKAVYSVTLGLLRETEQRAERLAGVLRELDVHDDYCQFTDPKGPCSSRHQKVHAALSAAPAQEYPEANCHRCGRPNVVWHAPNDIWNQVEAVREVILCPVCFVQDAEAKGLVHVWRLAPAPATPAVPVGDVVRSERG